MWHQYRVFISIYRQTSQMADYCNTRLSFRVRSLYAYCSPLTCLCPAERPRGRFPKDPSGLSPGFSSYLRMIKNPYLIIYVWDCVLHCLTELKGSVYWALLNSSWWQLPLLLRFCNINIQYGIWALNWKFWTCLVRSSRLKGLNMRSFTLLLSGSFTVLDAELNEAQQMKCTCSLHILFSVIFRGDALVCLP